MIRLIDIKNLFIENIDYKIVDSFEYIFSFEKNHVATADKIFDIIFNYSDGIILFDESDFFNDYQSLNEFRYIKLPDNKIKIIKRKMKINKLYGNK